MLRRRRVSRSCSQRVERGGEEGGGGRVSHCAIHIVFVFFCFFFQNQAQNHPMFQPNVLKASKQ